MTLAAILTGVLPSIGVLAIFIYAMRGIMRGDRREREAMAEFDRQEAAAAARVSSESADNTDPQAPQT